jgi:hypothetical protein
LQELQHLYLAFLYGLLKVKSVLVDDFAALARGSIGPLRLARMTTGEAFLFWTCKVCRPPSCSIPYAIPMGDQWYTTEGGMSNTVEVMRVFGLEQSCELL